MLLLPCAPNHSNRKASGLELKRKWLLTGIGCFNGALPLPAAGELASPVGGLGRKGNMTAGKNTRIKMSAEMMDIERCDLSGGRGRGLNIFCVEELKRSAGITVFYTFWCIYVLALHAVRTSSGPGPQGVERYRVTHPNPTFRASQLQQSVALTSFLNGKPSRNFTAKLAC
jgi:hypothetical protein